MLCNANVIEEYDTRTSWLSNAPLDMEYDNNITEQSTAIALNIKHNPYIIYVFTYSRTEGEPPRVDAPSCPSETPRLQAGRHIPVLLPHQMTQA